MLKRPITDLIQDIATIKYGGFELNFIRNKLEEIEGEIKEELKSDIDQNLETDENKGVNNNETEKPEIPKVSKKQIAKSNKLENRVHEYLNFLDMTIIELYVTVETKVEKMSFKDIDIPSIIDLLEQRKIINSTVAKIITDTRRLPFYFSKPLTRDVEEKFVRTCEELAVYLDNIIKLNKKSEPS